MSRTTLDIDDKVLRDLKRIQKKDGRPLGSVISELLAKAMTESPLSAESKRTPRAPFKWHVAKGGSLIDIRDKDLLWSILDSPEPDA